MNGDMWHMIRCQCEPIGSPVPKEIQTAHDSGSSCVPEIDESLILEPVGTEYTHGQIYVYVHSNAHKVIAGFFLSPDPEVT
jgi:hypothetical protein